MADLRNLERRFEILSTARDMTPREQDIVQDTLQEFSQLQLFRNVFASQWEETERRADEFAKEIPG